MSVQEVEEIVERTVKSTMRQTKPHVPSPPRRSWLHWALRTFISVFLVLAQITVVLSLVSEGSIVTATRILRPLTPQAGDIGCATVFPVDFIEFCVCSAETGDHIDSV